MAMDNNDIRWVLISSICIGMIAAYIVVGMHQLVYIHEPRNQPCEQQVEEGEPDA